MWTYRIIIAFKECMRFCIKDTFSCFDANVWLFAHNLDIRVHRASMGNTDKGCCFWFVYIRFYRLLRVIGSNTARPVIVRNKTARMAPDDVERAN